MAESSCKNVLTGLFGRDKIQSVTDNMDKLRTYKENLGRCKNAVDSGLFLEMIFIVYAMLMIDAARFNRQ
jgi:hypothetical protein